MRHKQPIIYGAEAVLALLVVLCADSRQTRAAPIEKPVFFATRAACAASKIFSAQECDNAFDNAVAEIKTRRLSFASRIDCMVRFRLCERFGGASEAVFAPALLGIEIAKGPGGRVAAPVLAVETTPGFFPARSIASVYAPPTDTQGNSEDTQARADRFSDHFALVDAGKIRENWTHFRTRQSAGSAASGDQAAWTRRETPQERRDRLKNAPFIE